MSDDEQAAEVEAPVEQEEAPSVPAPVAPAAAEESRPVPSAKHDEDEGRKRMEAAKLARAEKQRQEMAEYEEMRKEEREREQADIQALRERREQRRKEREEEEKRTAELRAQEEARRKAEDEERKRKKNEEERERREQREKKRMEAEDRLKPKKPNYVITKKDGSSAQTPKEMSMGHEIYQKSKEQLEEEKRAILTQRIPILTVDGLDSNRLIEKAKELHQLVRKLEGDKYDLEQQFKRQQYDMIELQERARQMNKGKKGITSVQVDESFDRLADKHTGAPPKIALCSKYERHTDHRSYVERKDLFEELAKEVPPPEIQHVDVPWGAGGEEGEAAPAAE